MDYITIMVPVKVFATKPVVREEENGFVTTIFLPLDRLAYDILTHFPEVLDAAVLTDKFKLPGHNHAVEITPLRRREVVYGELVEEFFIELVISSDKLLPEDLLREPDYGTIQLA